MVPSARSPRLDLSALRPKKPFFFWLILTIGIGLSFVYLYTGWMVFRYEPAREPIGWRTELSKGAWLVSTVEPHGPAAGKLEVGDQVLALNGDARAAVAGPGISLHTLVPGSSYSLRILRHSREREITLSSSRQHGPGAVSQVVSYLLVSLSFCGVAILLGLSRPEDRVTQLGCLTCLAVALRLLPLALWSYEGMDRLGNALQDAADFQDPWHLALGYHFYYCFSANLLRERIWSVLRTLLYAAAAVFFAANAPIQLLEAVGQESILRFAGQHPAFIYFHHDLYATGRNLIELSALLAMCAAITASYVRVRDSDQRLRVRWVVFGSVAGLLPLLLFDVVELLYRWTGWGEIRALWPAGGDTVNMCLCAIPFATAYAVLKHRALGISVVFRQSMKYLLARNVLPVILLLPVIGLILPVVRNPNRTISELFFQSSMYLNLILLALLGLGLKYRVQVRSWVDRKFFREAYNQERILRELIGRIKELDSISEISKLVSHEVESALHPNCLRVFYREKERSDLTLGYSSGAGTSEIRLRDTARILRILEDNRRPMDFPFSGSLNLPAEEREWLEQLETHLIVPITGGRHRLMGLVLLGEKKSEEPYTRTDRNLLEGIAAQMGVVYERSWLQDQVGEEQRIKRDVLAHLDQRSLNLLKECPRCGLCFDSDARLCAADGIELTMTLPVDRTMDGKYRLDRRIGRGGMGAVYEGTDLRLDRKIAVKIMIGSLFGNRAALRRFEREARAAAMLNHVNIVAIHDFGMIGQDGAYLVMERVYGSTWREELERRGALLPSHAAEWFSQLLAGLRVAHEAGIVHRDLKPENALVVAPENSPEVIKILDFGLAKMRVFESGETHSLTMAGGILGTVGYMSPEQLSGTESDERSDIFSVGVMVFEAVTGRRPFEGRNYAEVLTSMLRTSVQLPGDGPDIAALNSVLARCVANDPKARYGSVVEMQAVLLDALRACPPVAVDRIRAARAVTRSLGASKS